MPEVISNVPYSSEVDTTKRRGTILVTDANGFMAAVNPKDDEDTNRGAGGHTGWRFASEGSHSYDAMRSAWAMLDEHDQRIYDNNQTPDLKPVPRQTLWRGYYRLSKTQFEADAQRLKKGIPLELTFSPDGIAPYPPERLFDLTIRQSIGRIKRSDQLALDEIRRIYGDSLTTEQISAQLATDPYAADYLHIWIASLLPPDVLDIRPAQEPSTTFTGTAPAAGIGDISTGVKSDPSLPGSASNTQDRAASVSRTAAQAVALVDSYPENYLTAKQALAKVAQETIDANYWRDNYPRVEILAAFNPALTAQDIATPWPADRGLAPLVNVTFTPRIKPDPTKDFLAKNPWLAQAFGIVAIVIPVVGPIISAGLSYETNRELQKWAGDWKPSTDQFAPQYAPPHGYGGQPFNLPMPLDRAQIMVKQPWYAPAMVNQFADEVRVNQLGLASENYAALVAHYNNDPQQTATIPGSAPPASTGERIAPNPSPTSAVAGGGALPFALAGLLLLAGAPIVVPIGVFVLLERKK